MKRHSDSRDVRRQNTKLSSGGRWAYPNAARSAVAGPRRAVAELLEVRRLLTTITVTGTGDTIANDGVVTLREAITAANTNAASGDAPAGQGGGVADAIKFNIPGSGVQTITIQSGLTITDKVTLDGYTQPGAKRNTLAIGNNAVLLIQVQGDPSQRHAYDLLTLVAGWDQSSVSGLVIGVAKAAITVNSSGNKITGNFIGVSADGTQLNQAEDGIGLSGNQNIVGTAAAGDRNVIVGTSRGVHFSSSNNTIQNNYIGTNAAGTAVVAHAGQTLGLGGDKNTIGGASAGQGNVIDGATDVGLFLAGATHTLVQGNRIGTDASGSAILGNKIDVAIGFSSADNTIGGSAAGAGNVIAGSATAGVSVYNLGNLSFDPLRNAILKNIYFGNAGLNIDLDISGVDGDGPTPHDFEDTDDGPNDLQNSPVIGEALFNANTNQTTIGGAINSVPENAFEIDFYDTKFGTTSFVGSASVITDATGNASFSKAISNLVTSSADAISATATIILNGALADTSEFSTRVTARTDAPSLSIASVSTTEGNSGTKTLNFTVKMTGSNPEGVSVEFATANGTALAGEDYVAKTGFLTWRAGDTSARTIAVTINGDTKIESDETFLVNLSNPGGLTLNNTSATGTIKNDDTAIKISDASITEGNSGTKTLNFTVTRTGLTSIASSVKFATANGTTKPATAGSDYVAKTGTVSWAANDTASKTISITINGDTTVEANETFFVNLSGAIGATIADAQGLGTITNDDTAVVTLQAESATLAGGTKAASTNKGFTGTGYADFGANSSVTFTNVTRAVAGSTKLTFRYANGGTVNRPVNVSVNGTVVGSVTFPPTGSLTTYHTVTLNVNLLGGSNTIKLVSTGADGPNLDSMTVG